MIVVMLLIFIFTAMGIIFLFGKGGFLIAGYNTASKEEQAKYDEKKLNKCFAGFCFGVAIVLGLCGYVDTDSFAMHVGLPAILVLILYILIVSNTCCKKK